MKFLFTFYCLILFSLEGTINKYSYYNKTEQEDIKAKPLISPAGWNRSIGEFENVLYAPASASDSVLRALKVTKEELKKLSYIVNPIINLSSAADFLYNNNITIDGFNVGCTFSYFVTQLMSSYWRPILEDRVNCFVGGKQTWHDNEGDQKIQIYEQDSEFSYRIRRLAAGIIKSNVNEWSIVQKILSEKGGKITTKEGDKEKEIEITNGIHAIYDALCVSDQKPMTMTFANTFLNLCCLASDSNANLFGSKIMAIVKTINEDKRIQAERLRINFYKFDFTKYIKAGAGIDVAAGIYYPMFVLEGSKVIYPAISLIAYLQEGEWKLPIGRILSGDISIKDYEISGDLRLLGPSQQLVNVIPIGEVGPSTFVTKIPDEENDSTVTYKSLELHARLYDDISFDILSPIILWPNGSSYGVGNYLGGAMYSGHNENTFKNKFELNPVAFPSLRNGEIRKQGWVDSSDIIVRLFGYTEGYIGDNTSNSELLTNYPGLYTDYTIYSLSLKEIKDDVLNEPLKVGKEGAKEGGKTKNAVLVPACPVEDMPKKVQTTNYWELSKNS